MRLGCFQCKFAYKWMIFEVDLVNYHWQKKNMVCIEIMQSPSATLHLLYAGPSCVHTAHLLSCSYQTHHSSADSHE